MIKLSKHYMLLQAFSHNINALVKTPNLWHNSYFFPLADNQQADVRDIEFHIHALLFSSYPHKKNCIPRSRIENEHIKIAYLISSSRYIFLNFNARQKLETHNAILFPIKSIITSKSHVYNALSSCITLLHNLCKSVKHQQTFRKMFRISRDGL